MIEKNTIKKILDGILSGSDIYLVDLYIKPTNLIFIEIDKFEGISINECATISREVESMLDREAEDFEIQVSSPGVGNPFKVIQQYEKSIGKKISIVTQEGYETLGVLNELKDNLIKIKPIGKKGKVLENNMLEFNINSIKHAKEVIKF